MLRSLFVWLVIVLACAIVPTDIATIILDHQTVIAATMTASLAALVDPMDRWIYGAKAIAVVANMLNEDGEPDERAAFHALEMKYIDADKFGGRWRSTPRRILNSPRQPSIKK